ncbi:MAG TPA: hypothetical protein VFN49_08145 [Candidatus Aquilonibacter sp.]|nr:hypothetical protein [Candidatus Aquilonibacter sp.]
MAMLETSPSASPMPVIETVRVSRMCTALRRNMLTAIVGLRANDNLIGQGVQLSQRLRGDAQAQPVNAGSATGGAGASSALDDFRLSQLEGALADNVERIEAILDDPAAFPSNRPMDPRLAAGRDALLAVLNKQKAAFNLLASAAETNSSNDLLSRRSPIDSQGTPPPPPRVLIADTLMLAVDATAKSERNVTPAIMPLVANCR